MPLRDIRTDLKDRLAHVMSQMANERQRYIQDLENLERQHKQIVSNLDRERAALQSLLVIEEEHDAAWPQDGRGLGEASTRPVHESAQRLEEVADMIRKLSNREKASNVHQLEAEISKRVAENFDFSSSKVNVQ